MKPKIFVLLLAIIACAGRMLLCAETVTYSYVDLSGSDWGEMTTDNSEVWKYDSKYGAKGTKQGGVTGHLFTPAIDLRNAEAVTLEFKHTHKYAGTPSEELTLWVTDNYQGSWDQSTWQQITISQYATNTDWTFVSTSHDIPVTSVGSNTVFAFQYMSTESNYATWEVKNITITADLIPEQLDTISVSEALTRLNEGKTDACCVRGKVSTIDTREVETYGNISYWLVDTDTPTDSIYAFRMCGWDNTPYANAEAVEFEPGFEVVVYTPNLSFYQNSSGTNKPELNKGYLVEVLSGRFTRTLDWSVAEARRWDQTWTITIAQSAASTSDAIQLNFTDEKDFAVAGKHNLTTDSRIRRNGKYTALSSGYIDMVFVSRDTLGLNTYDIQFQAENDEAIYRLSKQLRVTGRNSAGDTIQLFYDVRNEPQEGETLSCMDARGYGMTFAPDSVSPLQVSVKGYITEWRNGSGMSFWMDDRAGNGHTFQAFRCNMPPGWTAQVGSQVLVTGNLYRYENEVEIKGGDIEILSGAVDVKTYYVDVDEAVAFGKTLSEGYVSKNMNIVTGYVSAITEPFTEQHGNISFWMSNHRDTVRSLLVYRAMCDSVTAEQIEIGTKLRVTGRIQNYMQRDEKGNKYSVIEIIDGQIEVLAGLPQISIMGQDIPVTDSTEETNLLDEVDIFNDGTMVYNIAENTLKINGLELNVGDEQSAAISYDCNDPLTIVLVDSSAIIADTVISSTADIIIEGNGYLQAEAVVPIIGAPTATITFRSVNMSVKSLPASSSVRRRIRGGKRLDETGGPALSGFASADMGKNTITPPDAEYGEVELSESAGPGQGGKTVNALYVVNTNGNRQAVTEFTLTAIPEDENAVEETKEYKALDLSKPMYNILGLQVGADYKGIVIQDGNTYLR